MMHHWNDFYHNHCAVCPCYFKKGEEPVSPYRMQSGSYWHPHQHCTDVEMDALEAHELFEACK